MLDLLKLFLMPFGAGPVHPTGYWSPRTGLPNTARHSALALSSHCSLSSLVMGTSWATSQPPAGPPSLALALALAARRPSVPPAHAPGPGRFVMLPSRASSSEVFEECSNYL